MYYLIAYQCTPSDHTHECIIWSHTNACLSAQINDSMLMLADHAHECIIWLQTNVHLLITPMKALSDPLVLKKKGGRGTERGYYPNVYKPCLNEEYNQYVTSSDLNTLFTVHILPISVLSDLTWNVHRLISVMKTESGLRNGEQIVGLTHVYSNWSQSPFECTKTKAKLTHININ